MINSTNVLRTINSIKHIFSRGKQCLFNKQYNSSVNGRFHRYQRPCGGSDSQNTDFDMTEAFIHTPELGYIRQSAVSPITLPNESIVQYVWKDISQWQNLTAVVSIQQWVII